MILDDGICTIFSPVDYSLGGEMPELNYEKHGCYWYGVRNFSTIPTWQTDGRKTLKCDMAIRVLQDKSIKQFDIVVLREIDSMRELTEDDTVYRIIRAYHGVDEYNPDAISDLSLEVYRV